MKVPGTRGARGQRWLTPESEERFLGLSVPVRPLSLRRLAGSCLASVGEDDASNDLTAVNFSLRTFYFRTVGDVRRSYKGSTECPRTLKPATPVVNSSRKHDTFVTTNELIVTGRCESRCLIGLPSFSPNALLVSQGPTGDPPAQGGVLPRRQRILVFGTAACTSLGFDEYWSGVARTVLQWEFCFSWFNWRYGPGGERPKR